MSNGKSYRSNHGRTVHYDEHGNKIGVSYESLSGSRTVHYDSSGKKTGVSYKSASGGRYTHYDADGNKSGTSYRSASGGTLTHYDTDGTKTGQSFVNGHGRMTHVPNSNPNHTTSSSDDEGTVLFGCLMVFLVIGWGILNIIF